LGTSAAQSITINDLLRKERETLRARAEQRVRLKEEKRRTEFMSDATHELRTPLAIIKGNIDLALDADRKSVSGSVKTLRIIDREVGNMTRLISDMATLTSQQGPSHKELIFSSVRLRTLIEHSIERCVTLAAKKGITMRAVGLRDAVISGDEGYLDKLFVNLIKNAILYGKKGGHIRVSSSENGRWIHVDVQDDGIGIPEKDLRRIFERLYRTAEAREKDPSGTGLGLAISKWVAEEHGGSVSVTSIKGRGSTFRVTLPKM
jgi:signal transduction histidine kinase